MAVRYSDHGSFSFAGTQPHGQDTVQYFADEGTADAVLSQDETEDVLQFAGAWSDLEWCAVGEDLHRIRHESEPTTPLWLYEAIPAR